MIQRFVTGLVGLSALLSVVLLDSLIATRFWGSDGPGRLLGRGSLFPLLCGLAAVLAAGEVVRLQRTVGLVPHAATVYAACALLCLGPWISAGGVLGSGPAAVEGLYVQLALLAFSFLAAGVVHMRHMERGPVLRDMASTLFAITYTGFLASFAVLIRCDVSRGDPDFGALLILGVLLVVFVTDIGALYVGKVVGRRKIAPSISPGKTVEGCVGGVLTAVVLVVATRIIVSFMSGTSSELADEPGMLAGAAERLDFVVNRFSWAPMLLFAVGTSMAAQIGDLFESTLKRTAHVKDSSALIPGMGGVLDVIDGVLFAAPVAWFVLSNPWFGK